MLAGRYVLKQIIGEGAFGEVYAGTRLSDGAAVAVKVLQHSDATQLARFHEEVRLLRRAQHTNVVRLLESGRASTGAACLVMEQLTGPNLAERLERGPLAVPEALKLARDALRAVHAFSSREILHRDLMPGSLVLHQIGVERVWKVIDFGIATQTSTQRRPSETVVGTPRYMAPEQLCGGAIDVRADLFALGTTLYEAITGARCCGREHMTDMIAATLHDDVLPIRERDPECPRRLEQLILRAPQKDPRDRPQSARAMLLEVQSLLSHSARSRWSLEGLRSWLARRPAGAGAAPFRLRSLAEVSAQGLRSGETWSHQPL